MGADRTFGDYVATAKAYRGLSPLVIDSAGTYANRSTLSIDPAAALSSGKVVSWREGAVECAHGHEGAESARLAVGRSIF